jgi:chaperonin GroES
LEFRACVDEDHGVHKLRRVVRHPQEKGDLVIRPLSDGVIVEPFDLGDQSAGGLHIPDTAKHRNNEGVVVAVGPGKALLQPVVAPDGQIFDRILVDVNVGDRVLFLRWSGYAITYNGRKFISLHESDIMAVVDHEDDVQITEHIPRK